MNGYHSQHPAEPQQQFMQQMQQHYESQQQQQPIPGQFAGPRSMSYQPGIPPPPPYNHPHQFAGPGVKDNHMDARASSHSPQPAARYIDFCENMSGML